MDVNLLNCTRTGRTTLEKTMEDGNISSTKDDKQAPGSFTLPYVDRPAKFASNGHEEAREIQSPLERAHEIRSDAPHDAFRKRINPLRIHLGKRPFVDNSLSHHNSNKRKKPSVIKPNSETSAPNTLPRVPKLIPKRTDINPFHNVSSYTPAVQNNAIDSELNKPVPRLIPKSQLSQYKKGKMEKGPQLKEYAQSLGLQPMVKFKCRKCCSMSFKTLAKLKEHQLVCKAQTKEPALAPVATTPEPNTAGPSRVTRKVYLCSACGTYYENWNLFLHMREVHNRHICLFCLGMFSKAEKLSSHLTNKHNVQEYNYDSKEDFFKVYNSPLYLMCCLCDEICSEQDDFFNHDCNNVKPKPVPVLISKNAAKSSKLKQNKLLNEPVNNGSNILESFPESKETSILVNRPSEHFSEETKQCGIGFTPETMAAIKDQAVDSGMELESSNSKTVPSPVPFVPPLKIKNIQPNGDEGLDHTDDSDSSFSDNDNDQTAVVHDSRYQASQVDNTTSHNTMTPTPMEKEGGIKLKLSLSSASSPVIINSTVDPTIGQQNVYKPPARSRRPPKRYEKNIISSPITPTTRTPSIKMTICDKAENPFVKSTIFENNDQELKSLFNNNLETMAKTPEPKLIDNGIKTTIYDNKQEDENVLNRVPKLTVRVPKELLDKDSSSDYSSDSDISDKLTVDENQENAVLEDPQMQQPEPEIKEKDPLEPLPEEQVEQSITHSVEEDIKVQTENEDISPKFEPKTEELPESESTDELKQEDIVVTDEIPVNELTLDKPLDKYPLKDLLKVFLTYTVNTCIYCNHARKIAVNCQQLALHMCAQHRFSATVNSITAEELLPETISAKVRGRASESSCIYINLETYDSEDRYEIVPNDCLFECFQCYFKTAVHKDLYLHNRKMHQKTIMLCVMCKSNFYSYSELVCHLCPGTYDSDYEVRFRCCICNVDTIPSSFRLMVHLRKMHHTCDVCLEFCQSQGRLSNHVWKHKLHHLCYRCGIAYRNKPDITNHLFWKHGTESVLCKKCLQKKWPHVYHFCTPPAFFACDECNLQFRKAVYLKVHRRIHINDFPHTCTEEECTEKFVSKRLLQKHLEQHRLKLAVENLVEQKPPVVEEQEEKLKEEIPVIDLVGEKPKEEAGSSEVKDEEGIQTPSKKSKKKKLKDKDALLIDVNLPALNLSESDSSDESDIELPAAKKEESTEITTSDNIKSPVQIISKPDDGETKTDLVFKTIEDDQHVLEIWDNFKKYQAKVEKQKEKTPPLVPIRKHVCESDHDYCLIPNDMNGEDDSFSLDKKKNKKSPKKRHGDLSLSSSSSSSDSDSSCSCGSNCSCSSSSGSSSSSSSDSDTSDESGAEKKKNKVKKPIAARRISNGSNVDVMGVTETPVLVPEKTEPQIAESDLGTEESETDEEFYDENPQKIANKLHAEKRNQLMLLASVAPSDGGSISGDPSRPATPINEETKKEEIKVETPPQSEPPPFVKEKSSSSKKKSKKKKKSKSSKKHGPIKINIPKEMIANIEPVVQPVPPVLNKITISLQSNTVQIPEVPTPMVQAPSTPINTQAAKTAAENKRSSKRRRIPNKFYGYSSDEEAPGVSLALKPQQPPKLEWRKEDLPSPTNHKPKKELPSTVIPQQKFYNYIEPIRLKAPIPDPEPPRILMNTESMESSDSESSEEGALEIYQPTSTQNQITPPTYLNSGTSSLPYAFQRPAVRQAREGESVYCYCRCPYDEVSEMIACDAEGCPIEWFHFECVGIMVPPKGKWYCPECRKNLSLSGYR